MDYELNERAANLVEEAYDLSEQFCIQPHTYPWGGRALDFGIGCTGCITAGEMLAEISMADWGEVSLAPSELTQIPFPTVTVSTDHPLAACLYSQYAGMPIQVDDYFAMGSGPMRAVAASEDIFKEYKYQDQLIEFQDDVIGVLESDQLPNKAVFQYVADQTKTSLDKIILLVAPVTSLAGSFQVVARSVETALHKLHELKFDLNRIVSAFGTAPLPPVAADMLSGIGRTNDAILYGGRVTLWVTGDDASLEKVGKQVPSSSSEMAGKPFADIFKEAGNDFYQIDPLLFSPAEILFQNIETGNVFHFGHLSPEILKKSFGV